MGDMVSSSRKHMLTFALGAIGGGLLVVWATNAVPRMMSKMMQKMMARMREEGGDPAEM